jgi:hypothetical protein
MATEHHKNTLGILAGGGQLPALIIEACRTSGRAYYVIAFKDQADPQVVSDSPHAWMRLGAAGKTISLLKEHGVTELVFAGSIRRPSMSQIYPDMWAAKFLAHSGVLALGDDGFLKTLIKTLERKLGFSVVSPDSLIPGLLAESQLYSPMAPSSQDQIDIRTAVQAALELGRQDIGQAAIAHGGQVLALESSSGTDAMLNRVADNRAGDRSGTNETAGMETRSGGVLAKVAKPQQELRIDLPTIGIQTLDNAAKAGLNGIVIEAGRALVIDKQAMFSRADELGLFVLGVQLDQVFSTGRETDHD